MVDAVGGMATTRRGRGEDTMTEQIQQSNRITEEAGEDGGDGSDDDDEATERPWLWWWRVASSGNGNGSGSGNGDDSLLR